MNVEIIMKSGAKSEFKANEGVALQLVYTLGAYLETGKVRTTRFILGDGKPSGSLMIDLKDVSSVRTYF